jgi:hypothetical protein
MPPNPAGEILLTNVAGGQSKHLGHNLSVSNIEVVVVESEKRDDGQKADTLVAVPIGMVPHETEPVGGRRRGEISLVRVRPFLPWPGEDGLQGVLDSNARQPAVFSKLVGMDGIHDNPIQPTRLSWDAPGHSSFGQFAKRAAMAFCGPGSDFQRAFGIRIIWRQQNASVGFEGQHAVASLEVEPIGHVFRQRGAHGAAGLSQRHFSRHVLQYSCS